MAKGDTPARSRPPSQCVRWRLAGPVAGAAVAAVAVAGAPTAVCPSATASAATPLTCDLIHMVEVTACFFRAPLTPCFPKVAFQIGRLTHTAGNVVRVNCRFHFKGRFPEPACSQVLPHPWGRSKERGALDGWPGNVSPITDHPRDCRHPGSQTFGSLCNAGRPAGAPLLGERPPCSWGLSPPPAWLPFLPPPVPFPPDGVVTQSTRGYVGFHVPSPRAVGAPAAGLRAVSAPCDCGGPRRCARRGAWDAHGHQGRRGRSFAGGLPAPS